MRTLGCLALVVVAGCSSKADPCGGITEGCIAATINGTAPGVDQLRISIDKPSSVAMMTPNPARSFSLPVETAIVPPMSTAGQNVDVTVVALHGGVVIATAPSESITVPATGQRLETTFTLVPIVGDGGTGGDLATGGDAGPSGPLTITPSIVVFKDATRVVKGQTVTPESITVTIANHGTDSVSVVPQAPTGDTSSFSLMPQGTTGCQMQSTGSVSLAAMSSCTLAATFTPQSAGVLMETQPLVVNKVTQTITLTGKGLPAWVDESSQINSSGSTDVVTLTAVHGTSNTDVWAVGYVKSSGQTASSVYHYDGTQWNQITDPQTQQYPALRSVYARPMQVWVASVPALGGITSSTDGGNTWSTNKFQGALGDQNPYVSALFASTNTYAVQAGSSVNNLYEASNDVWTTIAGAPFAGGSSNGSIYGITGYAAAGQVEELLLVGDGGQVAFAKDGLTGLTLFPAYTPVSGSTETFTGVWTDKALPAAKFYFVTASGKIYSIAPALASTDTPQAIFEVQAQANGKNAGLAGIYGQVLATGDTVIYAVGQLGNQVMSYSGGKWAAQGTNTSPALSAVYVAPNGEVFAVGGDTNGAAIAHLF